MALCSCLILGSVCKKGNKHNHKITWNLLNINQASVLNLDGIGGILGNLFLKSFRRNIFMKEKALNKFKHIKPT